MKTYVRLENGVVMETIATDQDIKTMFAPSLIWVETTNVTPVPAEGWTYDGATFEPPSGPSLDHTKTAKIAELTASANAVIGGLVPYKNTQFQADEAVSQSRLKGVLTAYTAATLPANFYWVDAGNNQVSMTYADLQGLAAAMANQGWAAFEKLQTLKTQVNAAADIASINGVAW